MFKIAFRQSHKLLRTFPPPPPKKKAYHNLYEFDFMSSQEENSTLECERT